MDLHSDSRRSMSILMDKRRGRQRSLKAQILGEKGYSRDFKFVARVDFHRFESREKSSYALSGTLFTNPLHMMIQSVYGRMHATILIPHKQNVCEKRKKKQHGLKRMTAKEIAERRWEAKETSHKCESNTRPIGARQPLQPNALPLSYCERIHKDLRHIYIHPTSG